MTDTESFQPRNRFRVVLLRSALITSSIACLALAGVTALGQPPRAAEAAAEKRAVALVRAIGQGSETATAAFKEHLAPELRAKRSAEGWAALGQMLATAHPGLAVVGVTLDGTGGLAVEADDDHGNRLTFELTFEPDPPHRLTELGVRAGEPPPSVDLPPLTLPQGGDPTDLARRVGEWFEELGRRGLFSGVAQMSQDGEPLVTTAQGLASRRFEVANHPGTRFDLGSLNKAFTRVVITQLWAEGELHPDDRLAEHVPDFPAPGIARRVTLRQLLDHTSGLGDMFGPEFDSRDKSALRDTGDYRFLFEGAELAFEPGTSRRYSNAGYLALGLVIEAITGRPYRDVVAERVFDSAGMTGAGFLARDEPHPDVAEGYSRTLAKAEGEGGSIRSNVFHLPVIGNAAGSAFATAADLTRFDLALRSHRLFPATYTRWFFGGPDPEPEVAVSHENAAPPFDGGIGIAGGAAGVSTVLESGNGLALVVLANQDPPIAEAIARTLYPALEAALGSGHGPPS